MVGTGHSVTDNIRREHQNDRHGPVQIGNQLRVQGLPNSWKTRHGVCYHDTRTVMTALHVRDAGLSTVLDLQVYLCSLSSIF